MDGRQDISHWVPSVAAAGLPEIRVHPMLAVIVA